MTKMILALSVFSGMTAITASADYYGDISQTATSTYSSNYACDSAKDLDEKGAEAKCKSYDSKSYVSTFKTGDYVWVVLSNGSFQCTVKANFSCY